MKPITFITGNLNKVKYANKFIHYNFKHRKIDLEEIQSLDVLKVVEHKVKQAYDIVKAPVLVEDTALAFNALNGLPGTFIKFFVDNVGNAKMCQMLNSFKDRTATATVCYGFYDGSIFRTFISMFNGTIAETPRGNNGFGWDQIFIPKGLNQTYAEMTDKEIETVSPRKKALIKLEKFLNTHNS